MGAQRLLRYALAAVFAANVLISCTHSVTLTKIAVRTADIPRWCFSARAKDDDGTTFGGVGCFETKKRCVQARFLAKKWGSFVNLSDVSVCSSRTASKKVVTKASGASPPSPSTAVASPSAGTIPAIR